jgi:3-oxoacyl-[acyl-carrier-protein] synthase II
MDVVVTGISLVSALGSLSQSWQALLENKTGITFKQPFPEFVPLPLGLINTKPADLTNLTETLIKDALKDAKLTTPLPNSGVVIGSSRGFQYQWELLTQSLQTTGIITKNWLNTLPNTASLIVAKYLQTTAPVIAPMAACATGIWSIFRGYELIKMGECDRVLVGAVESPITPLTIAGFNQIGVLAQTGCYPFDQNREGLVLGEGGAILVLESKELALKRNAKIYGEILGFGISCDAHHVSSPIPTGKTAITAIKDCLERSNLSLGDISYIHAHGTSTRLNDETESMIINSLFDQVAVSSTKGATGHTLGASGAMGAAFCLRALQEQIVPPCVGLKNSEFDLNLVRKATKTNIQNALCFSFGFGGQNAILALGKY